MDKEKLLLLCKEATSAVQKLLSAINSANLEFDADVYEMVVDLEQLSVDIEEKPELQ